MSVYRLPVIYDIYAGFLDIARNSNANPIRLPILSNLMNLNRNRNPKTKGVKKEGYK